MLGLFLWGTVVNVNVLCRLNRYLSSHSGQTVQLSQVEALHTTRSMDDLPPRAATAPARAKRLTRTTLKRLTAIPPHKVRREQRHYPIIPPLPGSNTGLKMHSLNDDEKKPGNASDSEDEEPVEKLDANERRKRFLTMSNLKRVFRTLDICEDGYIDVDELFEAQRRIGGTLTKEEVRDVMWEVDDNMSGRLSMNDYLMTYRRSQVDESGFEPKRFFSIVEFLLMDRDSSGEISLDEAMQTLFERQGAVDLDKVTQQFFEAAGAGSGGEPPPGATVTFMGYYQKVGRAKPPVPNKTDLRRTWSMDQRVKSNTPLPPTLRRSQSALLPSLKAASKAADLAAKGPPPGRVVATPAPASPKDRHRGRRPATSPEMGATALDASSSPPSSGHAGAGGRLGIFNRNKTGREVLSSMKKTDVVLEPLAPITATQGLAVSALTYANKNADLSNHIKQQASSTLRVSTNALPRSDESASSLARPASEASLRRPPSLSLSGTGGGGSQAALT